MQDLLDNVGYGRPELAKRLGITVSTVEGDNPPRYVIAYLQSEIRYLILADKMQEAERLNPELRTSAEVNAGKLDITQRKRAIINQIPLSPFLSWQLEQLVIRTAR